MPESAFITIVGKPNVGKSSILNRLLGVKIAAVSSKPQTTRTKIMGVLTRGEIQFVFTDTPGFHKAHDKLGTYMNKAVGDSVSGTDGIVFVTEPSGALNREENQLISKFKSEKIPVILAINKTDTVRDKSVIAARISELSSLFPFYAVVPISAQTGKGFNDLLSEMATLAHGNIHYFPDDTLTDQPERVLASEIIREKILRLMSQEVPHGVAVAIDRMKERKNRENTSILDIDATIYCERDNHKRIIIGKGGSMLKKISTYARQDLERFFGIKVNLHTWVKVKENWRNREGLIHNFGLDGQD